MTVPNTTLPNSGTVTTTTGSPVQVTTPAPPNGYPDVSLAEVKAVMDELGIVPGQLKERLSASKKWEQRAIGDYALLKSLGITSDDDAAAVKDKLTKFDQQQAASATDMDRAVTEAKKKAAEERDALYRPMLVASAFQVAAAGRIELDKLAAILEPLDKNHFLTDTGTVDTAKVAAYVDGIAPGKGTNGQQSQRGPSAQGLGNRLSADPKPKPGDAGRAAAAKRFAAKT